MKVSTLLSIFCALFLCGCSSAPKSTPESMKADNPAKTELSEKLEKMTPEERAAYVQSNQAEIQSTYSGVNTPPPGTR
jgi:outer membrane murein-binding lipoprotein Lpp